MFDTRYREHHAGNLSATLYIYPQGQGESGNEVIIRQAIGNASQPTKNDDVPQLSANVVDTFYYRTDRRGVLHGDHYGSSDSAPNGSGQAGQPAFLRGRKFGGEELQLLLLNLLRQKPGYGYQLIRQLSEESGGFYTPSPGFIYPALTHMEKVGYIDVSRVRGRKSYFIAQDGEIWLAENQVILDALLAGRNSSVNPEKNEEQQIISSALTEAIKALYSQLRRYHGSDKKQQHRVTLILQQTMALLRALESG